MNDSDRQTEACARFDGNRDLLSRFEAVTSAHAEDAAVIEATMDRQRPDRSWTYAQLDRRRREIAQALADEHGVSHGDRVGLLQSRRFDTLAAMLGIATIGACYVPIDPHLPKDRRHFVMEDADIGVLLAPGDATPAGAVPVAKLHGEPGFHGAVAAATPLYVMYTSGSTGQPKGVVIPHRAVHRLVVGADFMTLDRHTRFLHFAPQSFDAATLEIWGPLLNGGTCVLCPDGIVDPSDLESIVRDHSVNALWLTAALFNQLVAQRPAAFGQLHTLLFGGERASVPHVRQAAALWPDTVLVNGYGPTENTTFTCCHRVRAPDVDESARDIPIGRPIAGTTVRIVDDALEDVAPGTTGELLAGGAGLASAYLDRPALTAERFIVDDEGERWYRTGDLVSEDCEGLIHFHGRADRQVKVHGHRIEPGEVEAALLADERLLGAHVLALNTPEEDRKLVAYLVGEFDRRTLQRKLAGTLPRYMVPSVFVAVDALPTTANGKVDVAALPNPFVADASKAGGAKAGGATTRRIAEIWRSVVSGIALKGDDDNFFDVGGTSLDMMRVKKALEERLGVDLSLVTLFQYPTVAKLAAHLDSLDDTGPAVESARDRAARRRQQLAQRRARRSRNGP